MWEPFLFHQIPAEAVDIFDLINGFTLWMPPAALAVIAAITIIYYRRDRFARRIQLTSSTVESTVRQMQQQGNINAMEAEQLLDQCNSLPQTEEISPIPELKLRLAAAYSTIVAWMILLIFLADGITLAVLLLLKRTSFQSMDVSSVKTGNYWMMILLLSVIGSASVVQIIAAGKMLHGSLKARNIVAAVWIVNIITLSLICSGYKSNIYGWLVMLTGIWVLYEIFFRSEANRKIITKDYGPKLRQKILLGALASASIILSMTGRIDILYRKSYLKTESKTGSGITSSVCWRPEKIYFMIGSPEAAVSETAGKLAKTISKEVRIPCETVPFGASLQDVDMDRIPVFFIDLAKKNKSQLPQRASSLPADIRKTMRWNILNLDWLDTSAGKPVFRLKRMKPWTDSISRYRGVNLPGFCLSFESEVAIGSGNMNAYTTKVAEDFSAQLAPLLQKMAGPDSIRIANWTLQPQALPPALNLSSLKEARLLCSGHSVRYARIEVYTFRKGNYAADKDIVAKALAERGYTITDIRFKDGGICFRNEDGEAMLQMGDNPGNADRWMRSDTMPVYGYLTVPVSRKNLPGKDADKGAFLNQFRTEDLRGFVLCNGIDSLNEKDFLPTLTEFFALKNLDCEIRNIALNALFLHKPITAPVKSIGGREFRLLLDEVLTQENDPLFLSRVNALQEMTHMAAASSLRPLFMKKMQPYLLHAIVPAKPIVNGAIAADFTFPVPQINRVQKMIELVFSDAKVHPIYFCFGFLPEKNDTYSICMTVAGGGSAVHGISGKDSGRTWQNVYLQKRLDSGPSELFFGSISEIAVHEPGEACPPPFLSPKSDRVRPGMSINYGLDTARKAIVLRTVYYPESGPIESMR